MAKARYSTELTEDDISPEMFEAFKSILDHMMTATDRLDANEGGIVLTLVWGHLNKHMKAAQMKYVAESN